MFGDLLWASGGFVTGELAATKDLTAADRLLADDLLAFAVRSRHLDTGRALLDGAASAFVDHLFGLQFLVVHDPRVPPRGG